MTTSASLPRPPALGAATQSLVDEARRQARILIRTGHGVEGRTLYERLADALEAAQRPPISPEVREEMFRLLYDASGSQFMRSNERHSMVTEQRDAILARFSVPSRPPVSPEVEDLVDEARRWAGGSTTSPVGASLVQDLADALEAAQRPPVSPEVRDDAVIEAMARALNPFAWKVRDKYMSHPDHEALELDVMVEDSIRQARAAYAALRGAIQ